MKTVNDYIQEGRTCYIPNPDQNSTLFAIHSEPDEYEARITREIKPIYSGSALRHYMAYETRGEAARAALEDIRAYIITEISRKNKLLTKVEDLISPKVAKSPTIVDRLLSGRGIDHWNDDRSAWIENGALIPTEEYLVREIDRLESAYQERSMNYSVSEMSFLNTLTAPRRAEFWRKKLLECDFSFPPYVSELNHD